MGLEYMNVRDEKSTGTDGGTHTTGIQTRTLNTEVVNTITGASLASDQVTLPAGTYYVDATCEQVRCLRFKAFWYNITDAADEIIGNCGQTTSTGDYATTARVRGKFTIAAEEVFELRMYGSSTRADYGHGKASDDGLTEVYANVQIWKLS